MSGVISTALRHLIAAGVAGDDLLRAVEEMEAAMNKAEPDDRTPGARRQAAYRARNAMNDITTDVTSDVTDVTLCNRRNAPRKAVLPQEKQQSQPPPLSPPKGVPLSPEAALEIWNQMAGRAGLPKAVSATGKRQAMLRQRLREHGEQGFRRAVAAIERSDFCRGKNERGWRADLGFLLRPDAFVKLLEGCFGPASDQPKHERAWTPETLRSAIAYAEDHDDPERAAELREKLARMTTADPAVAVVVSRVSGALSAVPDGKSRGANAPW